MSSWVVNPTNIIQSPIIHNSILFVMWAFNFGMNAGRSCWTNDVSDWSFKRIRPPGLSGGSGDGQRTNRSSQAKNMPWTWRTEMVVKGETYWNILEYLKDTTKWAPASCRLITSLIRVLTPAAYLKGHLYGYWLDTSKSRNLILVNPKSISVLLREFHDGCWQRL